MHLCDFICGIELDNVKYFFFSTLAEALRLGVAMAGHRIILHEAICAPLGSSWEDDEHKCVI